MRGDLEPLGCHTWRRLTFNQNSGSVKIAKRKRKENLEGESEGGGAEEQAGQGERED